MSILLSTYNKKVLFVINKINIIIIKDNAKIIADIISKQSWESVCVRTIEATAANNDRMVAETIDTKVSSATCFSILLELSILLIKIAANPNKTVNITEKTVVSKFAKTLSIVKFNLKTKIRETITGDARKQK